MNIAGSFTHWLESHADFGANIMNSATVTQLFADIDNSIRYMVSEGVVTDGITDEFTLKENGDESPFTITLAGETFTTVKEGDWWMFGSKDEDTDKYPYEIKYNADDHTITWKINVPIENLNQVSLSYDLLIDEDAAEGKHDTNTSAVLDYISTDGKRDGSYTFEVPKVNYKNSFKVTYKYTGTVPGNAPAVPAAAIYRYGQSVKNAVIPVLEGFRFSGWNGEVSVMLDHDVVVTGSWISNPGPDPDPDPEPDPEPEPEPVPEPEEETEFESPDVPAAAPAAKEEPAVETIENEDVPMAGPGEDGKAWALINLLCAIGTVLTALGMILSYFRKKEDEEEEEGAEDKAAEAKAAASEGEAGVQV